MLKSTKLSRKREKRERFRFRSRETATHERARKLRGHSRRVKLCGNVSRWDETPEIKRTSSREHLSRRQRAGPERVSSVQRVKESKKSSTSTACKGGNSGRLVAFCPTMCRSMRIIGRAYIPPLSSRSCNWCRVAEHERPTQKGTSGYSDTGHRIPRALPLFDDMSKTDSNAS